MLILGILIGFILGVVLVSLISVNKINDMSKELGKCLRKSQNTLEIVNNIRTILIKADATSECFIETIKKIKSVVYLNQANKNKQHSTTLN